MGPKQVLARERLHGDLLKKYVTSVNPDSTELTLGFCVQSAKYDNVAGEVELNLWEHHSWIDSRLTWNPQDYDGVKTLRVSPNEIWTPDTKLYNSVPAVIDRDPSTNAVLTSDGLVTWIPIANYRTKAIEQSGGAINSQIKVGSWTYATSELGLKARTETGFDLTYFDAFSRYVIDNPTLKVDKFDYEGDSYAFFVIDFTVKSRGTLDDSSPSTA